MSNQKYTHLLMKTLTNIYKLGGVNLYLSNSSCDKLNPSTHTCGRLFARAVQRVAFVVSIIFLTGACQQARLIPDDEAQTMENTRGTEAATEETNDSTNVDIDIDTNDWEGTIDAEFEFGGEEQKGENE